MTSVNEEQPGVIVFAFKNDLAMLARGGGGGTRLRRDHADTIALLIFVFSRQYIVSGQERGRTVIQADRGGTIQVSQDKGLYNVRRRGLDEVSIEILKKLKL